ncbi:valyl-tRNA synthetase [Mycoplasma wenyonii str. Massachusetts]|uniref:valine--tRNA ligase n=1 Tax=Mycoplasma wenyonii (strain Massachusetts) TaxID=1197325 RepID=I6YAD9_MYCWM|nr:class I tRNA ligase family protein [Mycoplasma wenyonii]AFN64911.1 valyl-tRNA synthetase [Mycoplasma wenyonii str. Massachusetts]
MGYHSLLLPPPNLTGALHLGHLWNIILQDFRFKWEEIRNNNNYWAIGVDHAGLSFQSKFDSLFGEKLSKENKEEYLQEMHKYAEELKQHILSQFSLITPSMPIEYARYTLEDSIQKKVIDHFHSLFSQGLIYKKKKLVNWDIKLQEVLADCEVSYKETTSKLYYLKYFLEGETNKYIVVATSRPETIFGDVAVFVHPEDERYISLTSQRVYIPGLKKLIPILSDPLIEKEFGSGAVKCTPAHDQLDWELSEKHNLEKLEIIDKQGKLTELASQFSSLDRLEAREQVVSWLDSLGLIEKIEDYQTSILYSEKSNSIVEKILAEQWFLSCSRMSTKVLERLKSQELKLNVYPAEQLNRLLSYLENMEDWCLSRQILWGIAFPIIYDLEFKKYRVNQRSRNEKEMEEEIVLDTWFSSSLWPSLVFEGRERAKAFFWPITTLVSGKDILLPWISRMLFLSLHFTGKLPFQNIFLHGLLRNKKGEKMSKSLGNGILPEELYSKYSPDVIRLAFLSNTNYDRDLRFSDQIFHKASLFLHKLEHILKFLSQQLEEHPLISQLDEPITFQFEKLSWGERWILRESCIFGNELERLYKEFDYLNLSKEIISFLTEKFSNKFLELLKLSIPLPENSVRFLAFLTRFICRLLYPFVPEFALKAHNQIFKVGLQACRPERLYPQKISINSFKYDWFFQYLKEVRQLFLSLGLDNNTETQIKIYSLDKELNEFQLGIKDLVPYLQKLNHTVSSFESLAEKQLTSLPTLKCGKLYFELIFKDLPLDKYKQYLDKKIDAFEFELSRSKTILSRKDFLENAPEELRKSEQRKYKDYQTQHKFYTELRAQF